MHGSLIASETTRQSSRSRQRATIPRENGNPGVQSSALSGFSAVRLPSRLPSP